MVVGDSLLAREERMKAKRLLLKRRLCKLRLEKDPYLGLGNACHGECCRVVDGWVGRGRSCV